MGVRLIRECFFLLLLLLSFLSFSSIIAFFPTSPFPLTPSLLPFPLLLTSPSCTRRRKQKLKAFRASKYLAPIVDLPNMRYQTHTPPSTITHTCNTHKHTHKHMHLNTNTNIYTQTHSQTYTHKHKHTHKHIHTNTNTHTRIHIHTKTHLRTHLHSHILHSTSLIWRIVYCAVGFCEIHRHTHTHARVNGLISYGVMIFLHTHTRAHKHTHSYMFFISQLAVGICRKWVAHFSRDRTIPLRSWAVSSKANFTSSLLFFSFAYIILQNGFSADLVWIIRSELLLFLSSLLLNIMVFLLLMNNNRASYFILFSSVLLKKYFIWFSISFTTFLLYPLLIKHHKIEQQQL